MSEKRQFLRFVAVGGFSAIVNIMSRYLLNIVTGYSVAIILAYLIGMVTAYVLSRRYVFVRTKRDHRSAFIRFGLVNAASAAMVWTVSLSLARLVFPAISMDWHPYDLAHVIGVVSPVALSFFAHKSFSFAEPQGHVV